MPKRKRPTPDQKSQESNDPTRPSPSYTANDSPISSSSFSIAHPNAKSEISCLLHSPSSSSSSQNQPPLIFTHGVGGTITSPAMHDFASGFSPISPLLYFQGNMNLSSRIKAFSAVRAHQQGNFAALGGRSMGARAAVMAMLENTPDGADGDRGDGGGEGGMKLVLVSYPLTAGKDGEKREFDRREKILLDLPASVEVLFVVGSQDAQCDLELLEDVRGRMEAQSWLVVVEGADHGMECRPKGSTAELRAVSGRVAAEWIMARDGGRRYCEVRGDGEGDVVCGGWKEGRSVGAEVDVEDE